MKKQAILMGLAASLLFSATFILNRFMSLTGGSWVWSSSLRFYWMLPGEVLILGSPLPDIYSLQALYSL